MLYHPHPICFIYYWHYLDNDWISDRWKHCKLVESFPLKDFLKIELMRSSLLRFFSNLNIYRLDEVLITLICSNWMKFYFFLFDWKKRLDLFPLLLDVYCVRTVQKNATIQYYYCKGQYCTVGISDSLSYFHYFLPCLDLRKPKHRTLSYPTKTVRHFQNHVLHRKMPQPRLPR